MFFLRGRVCIVVQQGHFLVKVKSIYFDDIRCILPDKVLEGASGLVFQATCHVPLIVDSIFATKKISVLSLHISKTFTLRNVT